jgi:ubiquinone biosynthesis accessory factor UbiK
MSTRFDPRFLEDLAKRLSESMPPQLAALKADVEANFKSVLQAGLTKLDLVTRQEFDVQAGVLARTREKLAALETRLAALEGELSRFERDAAERVEPPSA